MIPLFPWWKRYPNVNDEIQNLDWIIYTVKHLSEEVSNFINLNTIKYADPILWYITSQYEANTIVVDPQTGDAYISIHAVPNGVSLSNTSYWTKIYNYADAINSLEEQIAVANEKLSTTATAPRAAGDLVWLNGLLFIVTSPMIAGDSYIEGSNCFKITIETILGNLSTLDTFDKTNLVAAINEVLATLSVIVGNLSDLNTTDKSAVVAAINEVVSNIGSLSSLTTSDTSTIVAAINEVVSNIGSLSSLTTSDKSSVVNAVNELHSLIIVLTNVYNVKDYGAIGDGVTDDTQAFLDTIAACENDTKNIHSNTIYVPSGKYVISDRLILSEGLNLVGEGYTPSEDGIVFKGSWLFITDSTIRNENHSTVDYTDDGTIVMDKNTKISDLGIYYPNVTYTSHADLQYSIYVRAVNGVKIHNIFTHNAPNFIFLNNQHSNVVIDNVKGCPIRNGLVSVFQGDRDWFSNISWHQGYGMIWASDYNTGINYINNNAHGFRFYAGDYGDYENLSAYHYFTELYFDTFDFLGTTKYCRELRFSNCFLNGYTHVINAKDFTSLFFDNCLIASDSNTGQPIVNIIKGTAISFNDCNFRSYAQVVYCPNSGLKSLIISGCLFNYFGITGGDAVLADAESNVISNNVFDFSNAQSGVRAIRVYNNAKETSIVSNAFMGSTTHNAVTLDDHDNIKCIGNTFSMTTPVINANGNNVISDDTNTIQFNDGIKLVSKANTEINTLYVGTDGKLYFNDFNGVAHALYT